jgi:hypothetical protein
MQKCKGNDCRASWSNSERTLSSRSSSTLKYLCLNPTSLCLNLLNKPSRRMMMIFKD